MINKKNFSILGAALVIFFYILAELSVITWGIPNTHHPFAYHMDEWHQLQAVKGVFKYFNNNIPGAAHGPMFHFLLTGVYLAPFYLLHIINPFQLKGALDFLEAQQKIFIILRLNTLLFGVLSIFTLYKIAKKYLKIPVFITVLLFSATPIWITFSNYFKYDIALIFWILISILWLLKYRDSPTEKNYLVAGGLCGLAVATKISALPLVPLYIIAYFLFTKKKRWHYLTLVKGLFVIFFLFSLVGIPDVFINFRRNDYFDFYFSNLVGVPQSSANYILPMNMWLFLIFQQYPILFGHGFFFLMFFSFFYGISALVRSVIKKTLLKHRSEIFILSGLFLFAGSLIVLKLTSSGNRTLVLLPFLTMACAMVIKNMIRNLYIFKRGFFFLLIIIFCIQVLETGSWLSIKLFEDPRATASTWLLKNIPKRSLIGLENIPIYQMTPDVTLKEFYTKQYFPGQKTNYDYAVLDTAKKLPPYIIITALEFDTKYLNISPKKELLKKIEKQGYKRIKYFPANLQYYKFFGDELNFYIPILVPQSSISIYAK